MNTSRALGLAALLGGATSASAAPTFIVSVGDDLFVKNGGVTQQFSLSDNLTSMTVTPSGDVIGTSSTDDGNGFFELYRVDNPTTAPTLSLLGDFLDTNTPSLTYVGNTLYGLQQQPGTFTRLVTIDIGAGTATPVGQTGVFPLASAGSGYDASTDTFFAMGGGMSSALYDLDYSVVAPFDPTATLIGATTPNYVNHAGEFFGGKLYAVLQLSAGGGLIDVILGELNTSNGQFTQIEQLLDDVDPSIFKDGKPSIGLAVIPAPGGAAVLGLGALALVRRRR